MLVIGYRQTNFHSNNGTKSAKQINKWQIISAIIQQYTATIPHVHTILYSYMVSSVHIIAQRANRYIEAFHITISYDTVGEGRGSSKLFRLNDAND